MVFISMYQPFNINRQLTLNVKLIPPDSKL